ncbi:multiple RNA-binding domain-containing protein 1 [Populus alba x Populus x berolinensis]|nr:multiple RNA-binding domain-containing protein 1 [Populus alba x Populus x berolinensis]
MKKGKNVSMGFGFIEFDSVETATNICRDLQSFVQGTVLDGHALTLQLCHAQKDEHAVKKAWKDRSFTKLLVRDVAFEAKEKDLRQLFSPFGQILERAKEGESVEELRARTAGSTIYRGAKWFPESSQVIQKEEGRHKLGRRKHEVPENNRLVL